MNNLLKKSFDQSKDVITIILCSIGLLCGCQEKVKHIYRVPTSAHLVQLEQQERALKDSLDKYCAVLELCVPKVTGAASAVGGVVRSMKR